MICKSGRCAPLAFKRHPLKAGGAHGKDFYLMKKLSLLIFTILASMLMLASCGGEKYEPVPSTDEEARVVMTFMLEGEKYEIRYELYKMLFANNHSLIDGGNTDVWRGADKDKYVGKMNELIVNRAAEIYSVLHLAEKSGIDPYSKAINDAVYENIRVSVEGNNADIIGHGTYSAYLKSLEDRHMNYAVAELLIRYSVVYNKIKTLFAGEEHEVFGKLEGALEYDEDDVRAYYEGDDSARILHLFFAAEVKNLEAMENYRREIAKCEDATEVALYIMNTYSPVLDTDIFKDKKVSGVTVGRHELDNSNYGEYTDAALALAPGEVSRVIKITQDKDYYYIIYKLEKTDAYFENHYDRIESSYVDHTIGSLLFEVKDGLSKSVEYNTNYERVNHYGIIVQKEAAKAEK